MKNVVLFIFALGIVFSAHSQQEAKTYRMFDVVFLKPKYDKMAELGEAMAKHNREFHSEAPHQAHIWALQTGEYSGWWAWVMGPTTYTDLDSRPESNEHMEDWIGEVMPYIQDISNSNFWKYDDAVSYQTEDSFTGKEIWTTYEIKPFEGYRFTELLKKVKAVYEEKKLDYSFEVYRAQFESKNSGSIMVAFPFKKWAFFDDDRNFKKDFESVHGEGSWTYFMDEYKDIVLSADDAIAEYIPQLSGGTEENKQ
jgi:hypothetical protein